MSAISSGAESAREQARQADGRFGEQHKTDPGQLDLAAGGGSHWDQAHGGGIDPQCGECQRLVLVESREFGCPECESQARYQSRGYGTPSSEPCPMCSGSGRVCVDPGALRVALLNSRTGRFRASKPKPVDRGGVFGAPYVWRMIRFNNGSDMHMPVAAGFDDALHGGGEHAVAAREHLDVVVEELGADLFGRVQMMRGAAAWGRVLGVAGADEVYSAVDRRVGMPWGDGFDVGGPVESPEAFVEGVSADSDGVVAGECDRCGRGLSFGQVTDGWCPDCDGRGL